jgi:hypothetical protein
LKNGKAERFNSKKNISRTEHSSVTNFDYVAPIQVHFAMQTVPLVVSRVGHSEEKHSLDSV